MFRCTFLGEIVPSTQPFPDLQINQVLNVPDFLLKLNMNIKIENFHVSVIVTAENQITDVLTLRNIVRDAILHITSVRDYLDGCYHDVILNQVINEQGESQSYNTSIGEIGEKRPHVTWEQVYHIFEKPKYNLLRLALLDLTLAVKYPKDSTFFCFRCIESLRKFFSDNKGEGWGLFYKNLNISTSLKQILEDFAKETRHGGSKAVTSETREDILKNTWVIVDRFIIYAINDEKPLTKLGYSELKFNGSKRTT